MHTTALAYPLHPNAQTKKTYYDLFNNIPLFIPREDMSDNFSKLMIEYPILPYLDDKESLIRWVWFIHNKVNEQLEKPKLTMESAFESYYGKYKVKKQTFFEKHKIPSKLLYFTVFTALLVLLFYFYSK
jgi:hypothetical protein